MCRLYFGCHHRVTFQWVIYSKEAENLCRSFSRAVSHSLSLSFSWVERTSAAHKVEFNYCETVCSRCGSLLILYLLGCISNSNTHTGTSLPEQATILEESNFVQQGNGCLLARFRFFVSFVNLVKSTNKQTKSPYVSELVNFFPLIPFLIP